MSGRLLKSGGRVDAGVRPATFERAGEEDQIASLGHEIERLRSIDAENRATAAAHEVRRKEAFAAGREEGLKVGRQMAVEDAEVRLAVLQAGITRGFAAFEHKLSSLDRLAAALARDVLERLLTQTDGRADLIEQLLHTQLRHIEQSMILRIELSSHDFADVDELRERLRNVTSRELDLSLRGDLDSGACVFRLRLGTLLAGLDQQWPVLRQVLERVAGDEG